MINGVTNLIVTKIDVLNDFSTIELAETYAVNGQKTVEFPSINLDDIKTHLMSFEGWNHSLANVKTYEELPKQAKHYLDFVEKSTDTRISIVSTGPNRLETIYRSENLCCE